MRREEESIAVGSPPLADDKVMFNTFNLALAEARLFLPLLDKEMRAVRVLVRRVFQRNGLRSGLTLRDLRWAG